ncbi:MAG: ArnT family glycosyltransferase, partial [Thermoguttaceae bacterium]
MKFVPSFAAAVFSFAVLVFTSELLPLTWDEGESIDRVENLSAWFAPENLFSSEINPFSNESIREHWTFTTQIEGHPAGYGIVIALGEETAKIVNLVNSGSFSEKTSYRLGPILLFSLALGVVHYRVKQRFAELAAWFAVITILLFPRVFAHAHIAACDSVLTASWLLAWGMFDYTFGQKNHTKATGIISVILFGFCLGLTFASKFTGWIAVIPFFLSVLLYGINFTDIFKTVVQVNIVRVVNVLRFTRDVNPCFSSKVKQEKLACYDYVRYNTFLRFFAACGVALLVFWMLNPPIWFEPISGFRKFVSLNIAREGFNISILFFGKMYNLEHPLPWYNTIAWVMITVPTGFLFLLFYGLFRTAKRFGSSFVNSELNEADKVDKVSDANREDAKFVLVLLLQSLVLLIVRAVPGTPPHDGVRLFVSAFPFLAIIAAIGASELWSVRFPKRLRVGMLTVLLIYGIGVFNIFWYAPQWLSYYNGLIGGLRGATKAGMEPTYYWDSLDQEVLDWLE